jgi:hypothetical protein
VNPDCVVGVLYIERHHAGVFMKIIAIGVIVRDPGTLRDGIRTVRVARDVVG